MTFDTLSIVAIALAISFVLGELCFHMKYPRVIGHLITGILLGLPFARTIFNEESLVGINFLAEIGIIFLLLLTGMKLNIRKLKKSKRDTMFVALFSVLIPFLFGFVVTKGMGYSTLTGLVVGAGISLTAEGTKLKVLLEMNALNSKVGVIMLGAGILDDFFEVVFLAVVMVLANESYIALAFLPLKLLGFVLIVVLIYKIFPKIFRRIEKENSKISTISLIILFGILFAVTSELLTLGYIIGAFVAGIIINLSADDRQRFKEEIDDIETITFAFIIPFFFINIGLHFDVLSITNNLYLALTVVFVATLSKIIGAFIAKPFTDLTLRQAHLVGWGLNSRGAMELVIAQVALQASLIPIEIYSALVFMALLTTMTFPFMLRIAVKNDRSILNE